MITVLICDDEQHWLDTVHAFTTTFFHQINLNCHIESFTHDLDKIHTYIQEHKIDIALLDIDLMGDQSDSGIRLAKELQHLYPYVVILFVTSHPEFALDSYQVNGFGFLTKPFCQKQIDRLLRQTIIYIRGVKSITKNSLVHISSKIQLNENHIICLEKCGRQIEVYTVKEKFKVSHKSLKELKEALGNNFIYINRSVIINIDYIVSCHNNIITLVGDKELYVSNNLLSKVNEQIQAYEKIQKTSIISRNPE